MRADRLISMLMLLQTRGRHTASQLANELEVSERTIYRDVIALNAAGIPVYTESGPGGGISLIENYKTDLTGLRLEEAQALSMINIPEPLVRLGFGEELKTALLKLSAAIPPPMRQIQAQARHRIHLDAAWWFQPEEPVPGLPIIHQAVWEDRLLWMKVRGDFNTISEQVVAPYGLVAKASVWYLVFAYKDHIRARRVSRIVSAEMLSQHFDRPVNFDLVAFWHKWCENYEQERPRYEVRVLVAPILAGRLSQLLSDNVPDLLNAPPDLQQDDWQVMTLTFESFETARTRILGFGGAVKIIQPVALRKSVIDFSRQTQLLYSSDSD
jgi:predicted DNA-binding transcriptional regulator YafY